MILGTLEPNVETKTLLSSQYVQWINLIQPPIPENPIRKKIIFAPIPNYLHTYSRYTVPWILFSCHAPFPELPCPPQLLDEIGSPCQRCTQQAERLARPGWWLEYRISALQREWVGWFVSSVEEGFHLLTVGQWWPSPCRPPGRGRAWRETQQSRCSGLESPLSCHLEVAS